MKKRFEKHFIPEPNSGCWLWIGGILGSGYGSFSINDKTVLAHRVSFEIYKQEIPKGLCVLHKCDVPCCVNPNHLFVGTLKENSQDKVKKKRCWQSNKTHCSKGHQFSKENTSYYRQKDGYIFRRCSECNRINARKYHEINKLKQVVKV